MFPLRPYLNSNVAWSTRLASALDVAEAPARSLARPIALGQFDGTFRSERLVGTTSADTISGGEGSDTLTGGNGNDLIFGFGPSDTGESAGTISATLVASGLSNPIFAASPPGDPNRLFVVEQHTGRVMILDLQTNSVNAAPFLDIADSELAGGREQGLLGLAFDPDYAANGKFYVNFTNAAGDTVVREYTRASADLADVSSARTIITVDQPFANHNGGWMAFGPDGFLYIAMGDGGSRGDPGNRAQDLDSLLGKILRIDPSGDAFPGDTERNYAIPSDNPFAGSTPGADEIFAYGLRNPWRNSFDANGDTWIADVGQNSREEINFVPAGELAGKNFGWRYFEGDQPYTGTPPSGAIFHSPLLDYPHGSGPFEGNAVTGGYVYHGPGGAQDSYFFADFASGNLWTVRQDNGTAINFGNRNSQLVADAGSVDLIGSFAVDGSGRMYVVGLDGEIHRLAPTAGAGDSGDRLVGGAGADTIYGGAGGDRLEGGAGADLLAGGIGDDEYRIMDSLDAIIERTGQGFDRVIATADYTLAPGVSVEVLRAAPSAPAGLRLAGNELDQALRGNGGPNELSGQGGADEIRGYGGRDTISPGFDNVEDRLLYGSAAESTGIERDLISGIDLDEDKFVIPGKVGAVATEIVTGVLRTNSFDADLADAVNGSLGDGGVVDAVLFSPSQGDLGGTGHKYLVIDLNNDGSYTPGDDLVLELVDATGTLSASDFV